MEMPGKGGSEGTEHGALFCPLAAAGRAQLEASLSPRGWRAGAGLALAGGRQAGW